MLAAPMMLAPGLGWASCSDLSVTALEFGNYAGVALAGTATVTVHCQNNDHYQLGLGAGSGSSTSARRMANGANLLNYAMFRDPMRTQNWGNAAPADTLHRRGSGQSQSWPIYGQVSAGQYPVPGTYTDSVTLSVVSDAQIRQLVVKATVAAACTISALPLDFGTYSGTQLDVNGALTVTCTNTTAYYVNLSDGLHYDGNHLPRARGPGGVMLSYTMFRDAAHSRRWGNTLHFDGVAGTGNGKAQPLTVYGRVFAGQYVTPGNYSDTIVATVTY